MDMQKETLFSEVETANSKQLAVLKANFPQCFDKNGAFIQEKLLEIVKSSDVELSKESYSLNWLGKSYARLLANLPPKTLLTEDKDHNQREENKNSQNLLIKGDNLEVLKHMVNAYAEKVKMIYIDPPYNTGKDGFAYNDDRKFTPEQLSALAGIDLDEAARILDFTVKGSSSHSAWLTFMYPRLYIAREFLGDDGLIYISVDDNESAQLKILCDEIFGEKNLLAQFTWRTDGNFDNQAKVKINHEYILCYAKNIDSFGFPNLIDPNVDESSKLFNDRVINTIVKNGSKNPMSKILLPIGFRANFDNGIIKSRNDSYPYFHNDAIINNGKLANEVTVESGWSSKRNLELYIGNNLKPTLDTKGQLTDYWLTENGTIESVKERSVQSHVVSVLMNMGNTQSMGAQLSKEFDIPFSYPKPLSLLKYLISVSCDKQDSIIMDFFSGSGTTAHSAMELNCTEGLSRSTISIQLPELIEEISDAFQAGYKTIFEITKQRLIKASEKLSKRYPNYKGDLGFKIFETVNDFRAKNESELTLSNLTFFDDVVLTPEQYDTLLTTWCVYDGSLLTTPIVDVDLDGYKAHLCDGRLYMIAPNFTSEALKALLQKLDSDKDFAPNKVVFYGSNFESAKQMELNEALKSYANKKSIDLDLVVRN
ncbi:site-specific DNA-methyltransferase [Salmonella enterica subsp. enterica serovar Braenderup]|uniref:site-specific DNA-methyltransferase (adenine-specific) n=1 Tax=Salmonella enterica subsp. enterica serovar Braenderup TaxID=149391 RepID=A0A5W3L1G9_SALET|nr:site-specific DNA-methyltransferase [Salmonella enterica subsp. enterica serovar Braenderup]EHP9326278.1 site-specific DNA-methyltransferase [Salmonella enterica subsp. enterica serovar Infantis]ECD3026352.1 site-specific DNA-methyltransferase [Salmonella enterica subsp. enterica serovar Braenderup]EDQ7262904.1 site-specific DNA-methyltransferase [Salmonella enterica subsp. enterica serovar Braenderup]EDT8727567.1 site-specific DNA-methyltransferase [Salmonella enterica subsp. enterica serov